MNRAVFLDRDGTINVDKCYLYRISDFEYTPGAKEALRLLQDSGYILVIITNQSGVARGYYSKRDVDFLHSWMINDLAEHGIIIPKVYYCPHHPDGKVKPYAKACECRKPKLELFYRAAEALDIDIDQSVAIGDKPQDLAICDVSGCAGFLLGKVDAKIRLPDNVRVAQNLSAAVATLLRIKDTA